MKKLIGTIFDIRRFSTHDGDGIRTTMFLKGCSLSCVWCHNPEGISLAARPIWFPNKCIGCKTCFAHSVAGGVEAEKEGIHLHPEKKENWDEIIRNCPAEALVWDSRKISVQEAVHELIKDEPFYLHGGGVTFSGGEPLLQTDFMCAVLKELKKRNINTAIETALFVEQENLKSVIPFLDLIYADLKILDENDHRHYTGTSNRQILDNIRYLLTSEKKGSVIIRTPMIPGMTAKEENIAGIARFISGIYSDVKYEILNYNPLASSKYHLVDRKFCFEQNPRKYMQEEMQQFAQIAEKNGIHHVIVES